MVPSHFRYDFSFSTVTFVSNYLLLTIFVNTLCHNWWMESNVIRKMVKRRINGTINLSKNSFAHLLVHYPGSIRYSCMVWVYLPGECTVIFTTSLFVEGFLGYATVSVFAFLLLNPMHLGKGIVLEWIPYSVTKHNLRQDKHDNVPRVLSGEVSCWSLRRMRCSDIGWRGKCLGCFEIVR